MEPQKLGNFPEAVRKQRVTKEQATPRVRSWTVQNEMRGVRRRCNKSSRFCQSWKEKSLTEGCVRCSVDEREHCERDEGAQVPRWKSREPVCQRILMRQYAFSPRKDKSEYER